MPDLGATVTCLHLTGGAAEQHLLGGTAHGELCVLGLRAEGRSEKTQIGINMEMIGF